MELNIKPCLKNMFPIDGLLIKSPSATHWLEEMQRMQLSLESTELYSVPGLVANSIWGCLILPSSNVQKDLIGKNEYCQRVSHHLLIPEQTMLEPAMTSIEIDNLLRDNLHIIHPEFGLVELPEKLQAETLLIQPLESLMQVIRPEPTTFVPMQVKSFQVRSVAPEDVLKNLEEHVFPKEEKMEQKPLNLLEKGKLAMYQALFKKTKDEQGVPGKGSEKTGFAEGLDKIFSKVFGAENKWMKKVEQDFEDLEKRNQKQVERLLDMLKKNPEEALKYAIPIDPNGSSRGGSSGPLDLSKRWFDFSLFGGSGSGQGAGSVDIGDYYQALQNQYYQTAQELVAQGEYHKAAFIYMKLLKNYYAAAETLEKGGFYQDAATIYLKYGEHKLKAAQCYEKGHMITEAIEIYKELEDFEKVGDLYKSIQKRKEANIFFDKVASAYTDKSQYIKASLIYRQKIEDEQAAQRLLLEGWRSGKDAGNCLNSYFHHIPDEKDLWKSISELYDVDVDNENSEAFLKAIQHVFSDRPEISDKVKDLAYEIVAARIKVNPSIVGELKSFNPSDKELVKDTMRYKLNQEKN